MREQVGLGMDVLVVTSNDDAENVLDVPTGRKVEYKGIPVIFFPKWMAPLRPLREFTISIQFRQWLQSNVRQFNIVHIHALFSYLPSVAMRICRQNDVPYIVRPSGLLCRWSLQQSALRKKVFLALSDRRGLNSAAMVEYTAQLEQEEAADLGLSSPNCVVPYGLHVQPKLLDAREQLRKQLGLDDLQPLVLYMSRVHPKKGIEPLLDAFERWDHPGKTLVIAGNTDGEYDRMIINRVQSSSCRDAIHFWGFATGEEKQLLLQGADVFVLPSYSESFGIVVAEAIASGLSVITTRGVPLFSFIERHQFGWIVEPTAESIAEAFANRFSNAEPAEVLNVRENGRGAVLDAFGWDSVCRQVTELYTHVLRSSGN